MFFPSLLLNKSLMRAGGRGACPCNVAKHNVLSLGARSSLTHLYLPHILSSTFNIQVFREGRGLLKWNSLEEPGRKFSSAYTNTGYTQSRT